MDSGEIPSDDRLDASDEDIPDTPWHNIPVTLTHQADSRQGQALGHRHGRRGWHPRSDRPYPSPSYVHNDFTVFVDVKHFAADEISARATRDFAIVEASMSPKTDPHGIINRRFSRRVPLPQNVIPETVEFLHWPREQYLLITAPVVSMADTANASEDRAEENSVDTPGEVTGSEAAIGPKSANIENDNEADEVDSITIGGKEQVTHQNAPQESDAEDVDTAEKTKSEDKADEVEMAYPTERERALNDHVKDEMKPDAFNQTAKQKDSSEDALSQIGTQTRHTDTEDEKPIDAKDKDTSSTQKDGKGDNSEENGMGTKGEEDSNTKTALKAKSENTKEETKSETTKEEENPQETKDEEIGRTRSDGSKNEVILYEGIKEANSGDRKDEGKSKNENEEAISEDPKDGAISEDTEYEVKSEDMKEKPKCDDRNMDIKYADIKQKPNSENTKREVTSSEDLKEKTNSEDTKNEAIPEDELKSDYRKEKEETSEDLKEEAISEDPKEKEKPADKKEEGIPEDKKETKSPKDEALFHDTKEKAEREETKSMVNKEGNKKDIGANMDTENTNGDAKYIDTKSGSKTAEKEE